MKKITMWIIVLLMMLSQITLPIMAKENDSFTNFRDNYNVVSSLTPSSVSTSNVEWQKKFEYLSNLIIVDDYLYFTGSSAYLYKCDLDGNVISKVKVSESFTWANFFVTAGDGLIFVSSQSYIIAYDQNTLEEKWKSTKLDGTIQSAMIYYQGYIYVGTTGLNSGFYGLKVNSNEFWKYDDCAFYWNQPIICEEQVVFVTAKGDIVLHSLKDNTVVSMLSLNETINSSPTYEDGMIYIGTKLGNLYQIKLENKKFEVNGTLNLKGVETTSSPAIANSKLYIGSKAEGDFYSKGYIEVIDLNNFTLQASYEVEANVQSTPLISTAYKNKNFVYFSFNGKPGGIKLLVDDLVTNKQIITNLYEPIGEQSNWNTSSIIADKNGNLYHYNDSTYVTKISNTSKDSEIEVIEIPESSVTVTGDFYPNTKVDLVTLDNDKESVTLLDKASYKFNAYEVIELNIYHPDYDLDSSQLVTVNYELPKEFSKERTVVYLIENNQLKEVYNGNQRAETISFEMPLSGKFIIAQKVLNTTIEADTYVATVTGDLDSDISFDIKETNVDFNKVNSTILNQLINIKSYQFAFERNNQIINPECDLDVYFELPYEIDFKNLKLYVLNNNELKEISVKHDELGIRFTIKANETFVVAEQKQEDSTKEDLEKEEQVDEIPSVDKSDPIDEQPDNLIDSQKETIDSNVPKTSDGFELLTYLCSLSISMIAFVSIVLKKERI